MIKIKKLLVGLLVLLVLVTDISLYRYEAQAAENLSEGDWQYSANNDGETLVITKYLGKGGNVAVPATIAGKKVTSIGYGAFQDDNSITSATLPDGITSIRQNAFYQCGNLASITLPNSIISIASGAFSNCTALSSITVAEENAKYDSRGNCNAVIETQSNELIVGCKNTTIPSNVTGIGSQAFSGCTGLTDITLPDGIKSIGDEAFKECGLTSIVIPQSVTSLNGMNSKNPFYGCIALSSIEVADGNAKYDSRNNCNAVIEKSSNTLVVGCKNTKIPEGVAIIGGDAFRKCSSLAAIEIPDSVTEIGYRAFLGCSSLSAVTIPKNVESIKDAAFADCSGLKSIDLPAGIKKIAMSTFMGCSNLSTVNIPNGVETIESQAFWGCSGLEAISIPESVTKIDHAAFYNCKSLKSITIPANVESIGNSAFYGCQGLTGVRIPNNVTKIGKWAFENCVFTEVTIPSNVTEIGDRAFGYKYLTDESGEYLDKIPGFTIHGYSGSAAEIYAKENRFIFKSSNGSGTTVKVEKIAISGLSHKIAVSKKIALEAAITPHNAVDKSVTWESSNSKYATVNSKGVVAIKKAGAGKTVTITAIANDGSGKKASYKIKCMKGVVKKVTISGQKSLSLKAGASIKLGVKVTASSGANKALQWTSSNQNYAMVTNIGIVTVKKAGKGKTVKITAAATDGSGKKATVKIKII